MRRAALGLGCVLALMATRVANADQRASTDRTDALEMQQAAAGVYVQYGAIDDLLPRNGGNIANLSFVVGDRCVAVIDTGGTPEVGARLAAAVKRATPLPVCYVINTHEHPDHVLGNVAFAASAGSSAPTSTPTFVASEHFPAALAARESFFLRALQRDFGVTLGHAQVIYPSLRVSGTLNLDLGHRMLHLQSWPTAHTDNDLTVYDDTSKTLFLGDLLFVTHLPVIDGNLRGWLAAMDALQSFDVVLAVPGHGRAVGKWPEPMAAQRRYLTKLRDDTRAAIKSGWTLPTTVDRIGPPTTDDWQLIDLFHKRNVTAAYAELEWEN